jgi:hypothetical protein
MLTDLFPQSANMRGSVEFAVSGEGSVSALGIRAAPAPSYTSIPAFSRER